jgi:hypothetical protein
MSRDFALLLEHLRNRTGEVELDVPAPQGNGDAATAAPLARARQVALRRGDRVAYLYKLGEGRRARDGNDRRFCLVVAAPHDPPRSASHWVTLW